MDVTVHAVTSRPGRLARARLGANVQRSVNAGFQYDAPAGAGQRPALRPLRFSARLRLPLGRPQHEVSPIPPAQYGHAPLVWQAASCRRDDRGGEPMVKSVGISRGGPSGTALRRDAPERTRATLALAMRYDAIPGLSEFVGDPPRDRALGR